MAAPSNILSTNVWSRLQICLGKPLVQRCREIEDILKTSSNKDLSAVLPNLLERMFGSGADPGWGLDVVTRHQQPYEFEALVHLFGPEGPLMDLVFHLQTDMYLTYDFPFENLPAPTRHMIEEGSIPLFYVNKLQYQNYAKPVVTLNAFELYMFHFAHTLVCSQWQAKVFNWNNMKEVVYSYLLEEYLKFFLPLNKKSLPKFPQPPQLPVRNPVLQQSTPASSRQSSGSGMHTRSRSRLGLLKSSVLSPQKQHGQGSPVHEKAEGEIWWSETFIQVIAEFWFNQNSLDNERGISPQNLESFLPSNNHVRLARLLLKHVHSFANSAEPEVVVSQYQNAELSPLEEFKRTLIPSILQKKLYSFFRHGFDRWPLDTSFRLMLEMWLTYVQPWRYTDHSQKPGHDSSTETVHNIWFPFIRDNLLFFTVLFQEFLERCKRTQMTSVYHAYMMFRVSKVFSLPNLGQLLREAERMMYSHDLSTGGSYISPELSPVLRIQIAELERPDFLYTSLFGLETEREVEGLLNQIDIAVSVLKTTQVTTPTKPKSIWDRFSSIFEGPTKVYGDMTAAEVKKLVSHLEQAKANFCRVFSIRPTDISTLSSPGGPHYSPGGAMNQSVYSTHSSFLNQSMTNSSNTSLPDCELTDKGYQLTPLGRYQLINGLRKFDTHHRGNPDLQPIRSYENATMVRALYRLSSYVNTHYSSEIQALYSRADLIGRLAQVYLAPPLSPNKIPTSPISRQELEHLQRPRLSLRFLASYHTVVYLMLLYLLLQFGYGVGPVGYFVFLCLCTLVFGLFRAILKQMVDSQ